MSRGARDLQSLRTIIKPTDRAAQTEARTEARLRRAWLLVVGPSLVHNTRLLRAHRGVLLVGCWYPDVIPSLRASVAATWPQLKERLERLWQMKFQRMEIVPCDPPEAAEAPKPRAEVDAFKAVLHLLREQGKGGWTPGKR
jgi:hypothetical protein